MNFIIFNLIKQKKYYCLFFRLCCIYKKIGNNINKFYFHNGYKLKMLKYIMNYYNIYYIFLYLLNLKVS